MIKIHALYFLLLLELLAVLIGTNVYFVFWGKKYKTFYQNSMKKLAGALKAQEKPREEPAETPSEKSEQPAGTNASATAIPEAQDKTFDNCKIEVTILEEKLKEKTKLLNELQNKFDALEKEYLILYRQQQKQGSA